MQTVNNLTLYYTTCKNYCQFLIEIFDRNVIQLCKLLEGLPIANWSLTMSYAPTLTELPQRKNYIKTKQGLTKRGGFHKGVLTPFGRVGRVKGGDFEIPSLTIFAYFLL